MQWKHHLPIAAAPFSSIIPLFTRRSGNSVAYIIAQPCIGTKDTACVVVCPVDCIHPKKDEPDFEKEEMLYIDPDTCIDCNMCVDECPVTAIFPQDDLPAEWISFVERNAAYYKK
jgi:NAD-dependent dihydropyrimidine dehydrogenase PreA subunit